MTDRVTLDMYVDPQQMTHKTPLHELIHAAIADVYSVQEDAREEFLVREFVTAIDAVYRR